MTSEWHLSDIIFTRNIFCHRCWLTTYSDDNISSSDSGTKGRSDHRSRKVSSVTVEQRPWNVWVSWIYCWGCLREETPSYVVQHWNFFGISQFETALPGRNSQKPARKRIQIYLTEIKTNLFKRGFSLFRRKHLHYSKNNILCSGAKSHLKNLPRGASFFCFFFNSAKPALNVITHASLSRSTQAKLLSKWQLCKLKWQRGKSIW